MNLTTLLAGIQATFGAFAIAANALHTAKIGGTADQSHEDAAASIFSMGAGLIQAWGQMFHAAQGGTPVALPAPPAPPSA